MVEPSACPLCRAATCLDVYHQLSVRTLQRGDAGFLHQHAVDAYAAQHRGATSKPIGVFFALAGLYLALERGYNGREVQLAHLRMAKGDRNWPVFDPPRERGEVNVLGVDDLDRDLPRWMASVWAAWSHERDRVRRETDARL